MSRILGLAPSGFGKSTGIGKIDELKFQGLSPDNSYVISVNSKPLPFPGSARLWPITTVDNLQKGRRIITNNYEVIVKALDRLHAVASIKNVVLDDFNYIMQDWYMDNALRSGWDAPKQIGVYMGRIFKSIEKFEDPGKNIIVLAHGEYVPASDGSGRTYVKLKTVGKMVDEYVTPEGKFDVTLVGRSHYDTNSKSVIRQYVTNEDEHFSSPKSPFGMLPLYVPNDLGQIVEKVNAYYGIEK